MNLMATLLSCVLFACILCGCARPGSPANTQGVHTKTVDPVSGVVIRTHTDRRSIRTADRLVVHFEVEWNSSASVRIIEPDWNLEGWERIDSSSEPIKSTPAGYVSTGSYLLEPFLGGDYIVPALVVEIQPLNSVQPHSLTSKPFDIMVESVLSDEDSGELSQAGGFYSPAPPIEETANLNTVWGLIIGGSLTVICMLIWRRTRVDTTTERLNAYELFEQVADGDPHTQSQDYSQLHHAFSLLDLRLQRTSEISRLIEECERARFSQTPTHTLTAQAMARHTLELLGTGDGKAQQ